MRGGGLGGFHWEGFVGRHTFPPMGQCGPLCSIFRGKTLQKCWTSESVQGEDRHMKFRLESGAGTPEKSFKRDHGAWT